MRSSGTCIGPTKFNGSISDVAVAVNFSTPFPTLPLIVRLPPPRIKAGDLVCQAEGVSGVAVSNLVHVCESVLVVVHALIRDRKRRLVLSCTQR
jgi:hypothetical protein